MKKPNWLKTKKEKREDQLISLVATTLKFAVAAKGYRETQELEALQKESQELENENQRLRNQLLELELDKKRRKLAVQN